MRGHDKTTEQLVNELTALRQRLAELEQLESGREQAKLALQESHSYSEAIIETVREPLVVLDAQLKVLSVNQSFCDTFQVTCGETVGNFIFDLGDRQWDIPALRKVLEDILPANTKFENFEVDNLFPFIGHKIMLLNARRIHQEGTGTQKILLAIEDITERRQGELQLKVSETQYRRLFETAQDGILILDADTGQIDDVNQFLIDMLGYTYEDFRGKKLWELGAFKDTETSKAAFAELQSKGYVRYEDLPLVTKSGRGIPVEFVSNLYLVNHHKVIQCNVRDISDRKKAEEALKAAHGELERRVQERTAELQRAYDKLVAETRERERIEAQLRQAQKMEALGTLTSGVAHDFNNILGAMIGFTELAQDDAPEGSSQEHHLRRVLKAGLRARDLIKRMLSFSRQAEPDKRPFLLSSVVEETMKLLRASIPTTISIRTDVPSGSGLIFADPIQIQQVLMNLCMNAAHAMQERGGVLHVELSDLSVSQATENPRGIRPGLYMKLVIRDTGTGISPDIMDMIFDPFFTTKKRGEGTGLGLSVVHGIVTQHDGYIMVESEPGKGSTFTVYFPKLAERPSIDTAVSGQPIPTGSERVLFVDDEETLAEMGREILERLGYQVTVMTSSTEALARFRSDPSKFDLVITDQTMPDMTGVGLAREILAVKPRTPVIVCTGFSQVVEDEVVKKAGVRAFVTKPLTRRELARTIRNVLDE